MRKLSLFYHNWNFAPSGGEQSVGSEISFFGCSPSPHCTHSKPPLTRVPSHHQTPYRFWSPKSAFKSAIFGTIFRKRTFFGPFLGTFNSPWTIFCTFLCTLFCTFLVVLFWGTFLCTFFCTYIRNLLFLALFLALFWVLLIESYYS